MTTDQTDSYANEPVMAYSTRAGGMDAGDSRGRHLPAGWRQSGADVRGRDINVALPERKLSAAIGMTLAAAGLVKRGVGGLVLAGLGGALAYRGITGHCAGYAALGTSTAGGPDAAPNASRLYERGIHMVQAMSVQRPAQELYDYWHDLTNLPRFMENVVQITDHGDGSSHWIVKGPAGVRVEWDAEIIHDADGKTISWRSLGGDIEHAGSVRFVPAPGDASATHVRANIEYVPPAGRLSHKLATLLGQSPENDLKEDLRRFKALMETGEVSTTEGQPVGSCDD